jgi:hypothetical protein
LWAARRELQEGGFAVEPSLLANAEWNPATLIQMKFEHLANKLWGINESRPPKSTFVNLVRVIIF